MEVGRLLREIRERRGLYRWQAAARLNCSPDALYRYEVGRCEIPLDLLVKASKVYGTPELVLAHPTLAAAIEIARAA